VIEDYVVYSDPKSLNKKFNRKGNCDYKKCKAACCRFSALGTVTSLAQEKYFKGFGYKIVQIGENRIIIDDRPCNYLDLKTYKCKRQKTKPMACRQFPLPHDEVFKRVRKVCTHSFIDQKVEKDLTMSS